MQVFTNKAIFSDPSLKLAQLTFAAFHFCITWLTLFVLSRQRFGYFEPRRTSIRAILPLSIAMSLNVILPNLSLAFSSVTFYQVARILLTPCVALMNFVLYKATLPRAALLALIPACAGVGMVSYYDSLPAADATVKTTSGLGVVFAFSGIFASSLYTVWIGAYHRKLQMSSMQLLFNQAPVSAFMLLYIIPFVDTFPVWTEVPINRWVMIMIVSIFTRVPSISPDEHSPVHRNRSAFVLGCVLSTTLFYFDHASPGDSLYAPSPFPTALFKPGSDMFCTRVTDSNTARNSLAASPRSSTSPNSSSSHRRVLSPAPSWATSRLAPSSPWAG